MTYSSPTGLLARCSADRPGAAALRRSVGLLLCGACVVLATAPVSGQVTDMPAYCSLVEVEKVQLSNATIVTLRANGLLKTEADWRSFLVEKGPGDYDRKQTTRFSMRIANARSEVGSFIDINLYPISHLELTIPPDATQGIGLELTTVLFNRGGVGHVKLTDITLEWERVDSRMALDMLMTENRRGIILIATSDRHTATAGRPASARVQAPTPRLSVAHTDGRLDVHAVGVTAARLLDEIRRQTGSKMALAQPSPAIATIHLEDMSLANALEVIARGYGLGVARIDGGYVLAPGWPTGGAAYSFSWQRTFQVQHLPAEVAAELLPNVLDRYIHVDREHNAIVATGSPALLEKIGADIAAVDKRPPLFRVEATMVDMGRTYDLAAELDVRFADGTTSLRSDSGAGDITFRVVSQPLGRIRAGLAALEERGMVETCAESNILARGGQYSWVFGGVQQFYPYRITQPEWRGRRQEITLRRTDVGVRLGVWPSTGEQGRTRCYVDLRASNILSVDSEGLPLVASREVRTLMHMAEHETIYVGGIELDQIETRRGKVPLLGDLPVLGRLFRSRRRVTTRRAVAIFLTVHVEGQEGGEHTAEADWPMPVAAQWEDGSDPHSVFEGSFDG